MFGKGRTKHEPKPEVALGKKFKSAPLQRKIVFLSEFLFGYM